MSGSVARERRVLEDERPCEGLRSLFLRFEDDAPKEINILDVAGRRVMAQANITATTHYLPIGALAGGAYWVRVSDGLNIKAKKLIIH